MAQRAGHLTTLVIEKQTLKTLRHMARKDETYNDLINSLINLKLQQQNVNVKENSEEEGLQPRPPQNCPKRLINND